MLSLVTAGEGAGRIPASGECQGEIKGRGVGRERGKERGRERGKGTYNYIGWKR